MKLKAIKIDNNIWKLNEITMVKLDSCLYKSEKYNSKIVSNKQYKISEVMFNFDNNRLYNISITNKIEDSAKDIIFIDSEDNEKSLLDIYNLINIISCDFIGDLPIEEVLSKLYENVDCKVYLIFGAKIIELVIKE